MRTLASRALPVLLGFAAVVAAVWLLSGRVDDPRVEGGGAGGAAEPIGAQDGPGGVAAPEDAGPLAATLVAGGEAYLPLPPDGLRGAVGAEAQGDALQVVGVGSAGFLAGSETDQVYVLWDGEPPAEGDLVDLEGTVRPAPADAGRVAGGDEAARRALRDVGGYVDADAVSVR